MSPGLTANPAGKIASDQNSKKEQSVGHPVWLTPLS